MSGLEEPFPLGAIPERLKCSLCTALARDAWKLPCCDQIVCGTCFDTLPSDACPICAFSPLDKTICAISTSLRTTIAVFLRHAEKRYNDALAKEAKEKGTTAEARTIDNAGKPATKHALPFVDHPQYALQTVKDPETPMSSFTGLAQPEVISTNGQQSNLTDMDTIQQSGHLSNMYGSGMPALNMGFPLMTNFAMAPVNPMIMPAITESSDFGGYGYVGNWNPQAKQNYTQQNMYMQTQDQDFSDLAPAGPSQSEHPRGGYRGRYISRGIASFRGGRGAHSFVATTAAPVVVEGAPTGPSAMRNGHDSHGRNSRGRDGHYHNSVIERHKNVTTSVSEQFQTDAASNVMRGRSMTRSITRDESYSPRPTRRRRSRSPGRGANRSRSRSRTRDGHRERRQRSSKTKNSPRPHDTMRSPLEDLEAKVPERHLKIKGRALADRIERRSFSRERSKSPLESRSKSHRSSHRRARHRSTSRDRSGRPRSRSRSKERPRRSKHERRDREQETTKHKKVHNVFADGEDGRETGKASSSSRTRSHDRHSRKSSRRSSAKYEVGSPELRQIEEEREYARYD